MTEQCYLGVNFIEVMRAFTVISSESAFFHAQERGVLRFIGTVPLKLLLFSRFPYMMIINHIRKSNRHKFHLNGFTASEVASMPFMHDENYDAESGYKKNQNPTAVNYIKSMSDAVISQPHRNVVAALMQHNRIWINEWDQNLYRVATEVPDESGQVNTINSHFYFPSPGFVYTTMVYGKKFSKYMRKWFIHFSKATRDSQRPLMLFALDDMAMNECERLTHLEFEKEANHDNNEDFFDTKSIICVRGGIPGIINKFLIPWVLATYGVDSVWVDFDVYFFQDPTPYILEHQNREDFHILISGSFTNHCICNGIVYFKATERVQKFLSDITNWMYNHPYEHDQKCFAGYLDWTERIVINKNEIWRGVFKPGNKLYQKVPPWDTLDPIQRFVTAAVVEESNGWMGEPQDVVLFHMLHGDSDTESKMNTSGAFLKTSNFYRDALGAPRIPKKVEEKEDWVPPLGEWKPEY